MAIAMVQEFPVDPDDRSTTNYDSIKEGLNVHADPPQGLIVHTAGFTGTGLFRIFDVWESEEACGRAFEQRIHPAVYSVFKEMGFRPDGEPPVNRLDIIDATGSLLST
jgi:hypothetical protein